MKFSTTQPAMRSALQAVNRIIKAESALMILRNVLIQADSDGLRLTTTDLSMTLSVRVSAEVESEGAIALPARRLHELVNTMPDEQITFTCSDAKAAITCGKSKSNMSGVKASDLPPVPVIAEATVVEFEPDDLRRAIECTAFSAAKEASRPVLMAVYMELDDNGAIFASTDGTRLSEYRHKWPKSEDHTRTLKTRMLVPYTSLQEVAHIIDDQALKCGVSENGSHAIFRTDKSQLICSLMQGQFPAYSAFLEGAPISTAQINCDALRRAVKTVSASPLRGLNIVHFDFHGEPEATMTVSSRYEGNNITGEVTLASLTGNDFCTSFNARYVEEALDRFEGEISIDRKEMKALITIRSIGDDKYMHIIMPYTERAKANG